MAASTRLSGWATRLLPLGSKSGPSTDIHKPQLFICTQDASYLWVLTHIPETGCNQGRRNAGDRKTSQGVKSVLKHTFGEDEALRVCKISVAPQTRKILEEMSRTTRKNRKKCQF